MPRVLIPVSIGELVDKITILEIKQAHSTDANKLKNIQVELSLLKNIKNNLNLPVEIQELEQQLVTVNSVLWDIENSKRVCEKLQKFDSEFIELARMVYIKNDLRASIKKQINTLSNSDIIEEKIY